MHIEAKLEDLGLILPAPMQVPSGLRMPFSWVRVRSDSAYISGHIALNPDGSIAEPLGKVGAEVSAEEGYESARRVALAHLASLKRALGDLDRDPRADARALAGCKRRRLGRVQVEPCVAGVGAGRSRRAASPSRSMIHRKGAWPRGVGP